MALNDLTHARRAQMHRGHQRRHVAFALGGKARIAMENGQGHLVDHARIDQLGRRDDNAFLVDRGGIGADRAGMQTADIGKMGPAHHEGTEPVAVKDQGQQDLIIGMRHGPVGAIAVIVPVEIARAHAVARKLLEYRRRQITEDRHHGADRHDPAFVEQGGVKVLLLANEGRDGGALDQRFHLALCRHDRAPNNFHGDGIAERGRIRRQGRPGS